MTQYSRDDAALRAGMSVEDMGLYLALGILSESAEGGLTAGEVRKASIAHSLVSGGLPLDALAAAIADGTLSLDFVDQPHFERFTDLSPLTFAEMSAKTGVPIELLMVIREAGGGALPAPEDHLREGELPVVRFVEAQLAQGFRPGAIERLLRGYGNYLRGVAETESEWWRTEVVMPLMAAGASAVEIGEFDQAEALGALSMESIIALFQAQQTRTWTSGIIESFEHTLAGSGHYTAPERPPAMCFLDITGYTRLTAERGDDAAAQLAQQLSRMVHRASVSHGGRPVKWLGDGVMCYFPQPGPAVEAALEMADGVTDVGLPPAHVGLHAGPLVLQGGDYFGQTVNIASRIAEYARPGEVLVSQAVVDATDGARVTYTDAGEVELKGVAGSVHLHRALWA